MFFYSEEDEQKHFSPPEGLCKPLKEVNARIVGHENMDSILSERQHVRVGPADMKRNDGMRTTTDWR